MEQEYIPCSIEIKENKVSPKGRISSPAFGLVRTFYALRQPVFKTVRCRAFFMRKGEKSTACLKVFERTPLTGSAGCGVAV